MSKTVLAKVDGFTPCMDVIVNKYGIVTAAIFGVVWRFCQMKDGVCWASQEKIGSMVGMSRQTANEHLKKLVDGGFLRVIPASNGDTVQFVDTGKASLSIKITGGVNETDRGCKPSLQGGVNKTDTKIVFKDTNKDIPFEKPSKEEPIRIPCDIDGMPDDWKETKVKKSPISENELRLANLIADSLGIKPPICNTKKEYAAAQVTWWKPIKEMLRQVDGNIQEAESIADCAIGDYRKAHLTMTSPKSVLSGFIAVLVKEKK